MRERERRRESGWRNEVLCCGELGFGQMFLCAHYPAGREGERERARTSFFPYLRNGKMWESGKEMELDLTGRDGKYVKVYGF